MNALDRTRLAEAKEKLAEARAKVTKYEADNAVYEGANKVAHARLATIHRRAARRRLAIQRPTEVLLLDALPTMTGYIKPGLAESLGRTPKKWIEAVSGGEIGLSVNTVNMKAKGFIQKARYVTAADLRKVTAARKRETAARAALRKAEQATRDAIKAAWEAGDKVPLEEVATVLGTAASIKSTVPKRWDTWYMDSARRSVADAERHLLALQGKGECSCWIHNQWVREKEEAEAAARRAKLPRTQYTCPACNETVVAYLATLRDEPDVPAVQCPNRGCGRVFRVASLKRTKKVPIRTPIGIVEEKAA